MIMIYRTPEGTVLSAQQEFLDDQDQPIRCKTGYPKVALVDDEKMVLSSIIANPGQVPGNWFANLSIPLMALTAPIELTVRWQVIDIDGNKYQVKDAVIVEPQVEDRENDIVAMFGDPDVAFTLPTLLNTGDIATYQMYFNNQSVLATPINMLIDPTVDVLQFGLESTRVTIPLVAAQASMVATLLKVNIARPSIRVPVSYLYKIYAITPQLMLSMTQIEEFLNKSRIENVIPELRYTSGDLLGYLQRGLDLFNMIEKPTTFTGLNMQGPLLDAHLICAQYYALSAQLLAEGSLAFDFSGQGISLNVDRTPQLEAALGRMEALMDSRIIPLKKELWKNDIISGDGAISATGIHNPQAIGRLGVINAATTRISTPMQRFIGRKR